MQQLVVKLPEQWLPLPRSLSESTIPPVALEVNSEANVSTRYLLPFQFTGYAGI